MPRFIYIVWFMLFPLVAAAVEFEEGRNYIEIPFAQPLDTGNKIEVREFFWYGCPHCYTLEPNIERWSKQKPRNVELVRTPWTMTRALTHAQAFYAFETLGDIDKLHKSFYDAVQKQGANMNSEANIAQFITAQGGNAAKFHEAYNSFGVNLQMTKAKQLNDAYEITSVPTFVVQGKYITSPTLAGGELKALKLVDYLVQKVAKERIREQKKN